MSIARLMQQAAAGSAGGGGLNVEDVFSTYLYTANSSTLVASNGVDLDGEGGLVWIKNRDNVRRHALYDTERGTNKQLSSNLADAERTMSANATITYNSDGFSMPAGDADVNGVTGWGDYASWTFRKAPKFFDVVTYTGDGVAGRTVSHNLGATVGTILVKKTSGANEWTVYHRSLGSGYEGYLNSTSQFYESTIWGSTEPTSTEFTVSANDQVNGSGSSYVAYLFAHNDGGADIIKCGSYTGNGSTNGPEIDLGFEPQWLLIKDADNFVNWQMHDTMRGIPTGGSDAVLYPNRDWAENSINDWLDVSATGFKITNASSGLNTSGSEHIYIAISS